MRVPKNVVEARRQLLADLLQNQRYLPLEQICIRLSISAATARRDLSELERTGRIRRTPGGALSDFSDKFPSFAERGELNWGVDRPHCSDCRADQFHRKCLSIM